MTQFHRKLVARLLLVAALLCALPAFIADALAQAGARVAAIEFKGNRTLDAEVVRQSLRTKVGRPFDESLLSEDVKTLYDMFATVKVEKTQEGDDVRITFVVTENASASEVIVRGTSGLTEAEVRAVMDTAKGRPIADFRLQNDARKIERLYRMKGYAFAQVTHEVTDSDTGKSVVFEVLEGPKVEVDKITFVGNTHVTRDKLLEFMATQETGFLGLRGAPYVEETLVKDRTSLVNVFRRMGYLDADVRIADRAFSEDRRKAFITIEVTEGAAFTIGTITFAGATGYPGGEDELRKLLRVEPGKRYKTDDIYHSLDAIQVAYHDEGFFSVNIYAEEKPSGTTVDLIIRIDEQSKVRVRDLMIVGNEVTQDKVIRRESGVRPGEILNENEIRKTKNRLLSLGYFTNVEVDVEKPKQGDDPNQRDVKIAVDDAAKTGTVKFSIGASSDLGILGSVTVTKRNFDWRDWPDHFGDIFTGRAFTGAGETFQLDLSPGSNYSAYTLSYLQPWLFDKPIEFGWNLYLTKFTRFDYDVDRKGIDLTLGRRFTFESKSGNDSVLAVSATTRLQNVDLSNVNPSTAPTAFLSQGTDSLIAEGVTFRYSRLDNATNPNDGWFARYTPELGVAGDIRDFKQEFEARRYWTLWKTEDERAHTLSIGARIGMINAMSSSVQADPNVLGTDFVPIYENYFAGGSSSVRGFSYDGAGPHGQGNPFLASQAGETRAQRNLRLGNTVNSILENDGEPMGGNLLFLASAEYGFPIYEDVLRGVLFCDAGTVRDSWSSSTSLDAAQVAQLQRQLRQGGHQGHVLANEINFDKGPSFFQDMRVAVGFGIRIKIPGFGRRAIALDFGFPVKKRNGDDTQVLSFSIIQPF